MEDPKNAEELQEIFEDIENVHYLPGPIYKMLNKCKALMLMNSDELQAIYHLAESHVPGLRYQTEFRYDKLQSQSSSHLSLAKKNVALKCADIRIKDNITSLLEKLKEMPPEWTVVQLTTRNNSKDNIEFNPEKLCSNPIHISVFDCGRDLRPPFCITTPAPVDPVNGAPVELIQEMHAILKTNKRIFSQQEALNVKGLPTKEFLKTSRDALSVRLKQLIKDLEGMWLKEWRCLLIGKFVDPKLEEMIHNRIRDFFSAKFFDFKLTQRSSSMLSYIVKGRRYMTFNEFKKAIGICFPALDQKDAIKDIGSFVNHLSEEVAVTSPLVKRHPVILVLDETLDLFPWESMQIIAGHPITRVPSLHMLYALFKEHQNTIKDGCKIIKQPQKGSYVINPGLDLTRMEKRMTSFFSYWLPTWVGIKGRVPSAEEFENCLLSNEIFSYSGHGSGTQFFPTKRIEKLRIKAVVLLFGCASVGLQSLSPQVEMFGVDHVYHIACSPCVIGMLWTVTDNDTDYLSAALLSTWVPSSAKVDWNALDKTEWGKGNVKINFDAEVATAEPGPHIREPELLRALSAVKIRQGGSILNQAACVARGLPVKMDYL